MTERMTITCPWCGNLIRLKNKDKTLSVSKKLQSFGIENPLPKPYR